jgi:hypothetical protein
MRLLPGYRPRNEPIKFRVMTGMGFRKTWIAAGLLAIGLTPAWAQGSNYDVKSMNFDMWCQEQAHLDPARCDKRLPDDEASFETFRGKIEQYEIPYLQDKKNQVMLDNNVLHKDPVDNPVTQSLPSQSSQQQRNPSIDPRTPLP